MDDYEESYLAEVEKEVDEIRSAALKSVQQTHPEIERVIDRRCVLNVPLKREMFYLLACDN